MLFKETHGRSQQITRIAAYEADHNWLRGLLKIYLNKDDCDSAVYLETFFVLKNHVTSMAVVWWCQTFIQIWAKWCD